MDRLESFLQQLNPQQLAAVNRLDGPLLVLAGAGTGKTKVLTTRIANLINSSVALPQNILAVTFTNKAAKEMQARIDNMINSSGLNIGTFHSIATRILRSHIGYLNSPLTSSFTIIDQEDQVRLIKNILINLNIDVKIHPPKLIWAIISRWKDIGLSPNELLANEIQSPTHKLAKTVYYDYQQQLQLANLTDFGDLLMLNNQLLFNNPDLLRYYQNKFKYILIDEYQDTNAVQYQWAKILASSSRNICCVGDDDQSIYSWRGAEIANILRFEQDFPEAQIIKLEQNYRSSSEILGAASGLIKNNKHRHGKTLWTDKKIGEKIKIVSCWNDKEEARFVIGEIEKTLHSYKYDAGHIAILVRAGFQTRAFEEILISNAIPYRIVGGLRFYERMEIRDLLAYIRVSINKNDNLALERIINVPKRAIGNTTLKQLKDYAHDNNISTYNAIVAMLEAKVLKNKVADSLLKFIYLIDQWHQRYKSESALEVTKSILEESGYLSALKQEKTEEVRGRIENINEMLRAIAEFENIGEFVEHAGLVMENDSLASSFGGAINLMTLHAAKGLEFDLVFLPGWEEGIFPHQKSIQEEGNKGLEEERRIAYVGITRAKKDLFITYAENRWMYKEVLNSAPSRFLSEIPENFYTKISLANKLNYLGSRHNFSFQNNSHVTPNYIIRQAMPGEVRTGDRVRHSKFGIGIITRKYEDNLEIIFEKGGGIKTIKQSYVEIIKA